MLEAQLLVSNKTRYGEEKSGVKKSNNRNTTKLNKNMLHIRTYFSTTDFKFEIDYKVATRSQFSEDKLFGLTYTSGRNKVRTKVLNSDLGPNHKNSALSHL